jgi:hypothetical protein
MRISPKLAALGAAATLVVTAAPVGAAPAPTPPAAAAPVAAALPALAQALAPQLTSLVEALQRDLGLTPEEFLEQAGIGERLAKARPGWEQEFRAAFGGVWLDDDGTGMVGVLPGKIGDALRTEATQAGFTVKDVALTTDELQARERQVGKIIEGMPSELSDLVTGLRVDPTRNAVVVTTRGGDAAALGNIENLLHGLAEIDMIDAPDPANDTAPFGSEGAKTGSDGEPTVQGIEPATARGAGTGTGGSPAGADSGSLGSLSLLNEMGIIPEGPMRTIVDLLSGLTPGTGSIIDGMNETVPNPNPTPRSRALLGDRPATVPAGQVVGGTAYQVGVPGGILECSTGFNGELSGKPVVVTAAHCAGEDGTKAAFADGEQFGTMTGTKREGIDTALIVVDGKFADRFKNNLVGTDRDTTQAIVGTAEPVVGQKACKTGFRTGFSCGTISQVDANIDVAGSRVIRGAFTVDLCALPGDSGGVVFSGDRALGISSASNVADTGTCANADTVAKAAGFTPRLSAVPIGDVLAAHPGLTLRTN